MDWLSLLIVALGSVLIFASVSYFGGPELLAWALVVVWAIFIGRLGIHVRNRR